jgi:DNA-binding winged helix-turn-helix (wHTH) protein
VTFAGMSWPQYRRRRCVYRGRSVRLTRLECELISALLARRGHVVRRDELIEALYPPIDGYEPENASKMLYLLTNRVRRKMPLLIETVPGRGLRISLPVDASNGPAKRPDC